MDCSQDLLELDSEISRINILKESDPLLPVLPLLDIAEEPLADGLTIPPVTPLHSPYAFLKEERWLFSPPPVMPVIPTQSEVKSSSNSLDTTENLTPHDTVRERIIQLHLEREQPTLNLFPYHWKNTCQEKGLNLTQLQPTLTAVYKVHQNPPLLLELNTLEFC